MFENILLNPSSKSVVIDPFEKSLTHGDSYDTFKQNLTEHLDKITILKGFSDDILPTLEKESFDIIYIDGDHTAEAAFKDGVNSFPLLKKDGILIFDDYLWHGTNYGMHFHANVGNWNNPFTGVNCFYFQYKEKIQILENFTPPVKIVSPRSVYNDNNILNNINYQFICKKIQN